MKCDVKMMSFKPKKLPSFLILSCTLCNKFVKVKPKDVIAEKIVLCKEHNKYRKILEEVSEMR